MGFVWRRSTGNGSGSGNGNGNGNVMARLIDQVVGCPRNSVEVSRTPRVCAVE